MEAEDFALGRPPAPAENEEGTDLTDGTVEQALRQAAAALQGGQAGQAERIVRDLLARHRGHPGALQLLGMTLLAQDRPREAVAPLSDAARRNPGAAVETYLAVALNRTGRSAEALTWLERATAREPTLPHAFLELGSLLYAQRRLAEAEAALRRGQAIAPGVAEFSVVLGQILLDRGAAGSAEAAFARALALAPQHPAALQGLGSVLMGAGAFEKAAQRFRQVLERDPAHAKAALLLASCLLELGREQEAHACLRNVVRSAPPLFGQALKACTQAGRGRLWLRPSAAAAFLRAKQ